MPEPDDIVYAVRVITDTETNYYHVCDNADGLIEANEVTVADQCQECGGSKPLVIRQALGTPGVRWMALCPDCDSPYPIIQCLAQEVIF